MQNKPRSGCTKSLKEDEVTIWKELEREPSKFLAGIRSLPVIRTADPRTISHEIESQFDLINPVPVTELVQTVNRFLREYTIHVTHSRYFGLFNPV